MKKRIIKVQPKALKSKQQSLHKALKIVLIIAQSFGQMPVQGIAAPHPDSLHFKWSSFRVYYCILNCIGINVSLFILLYRLIKDGMNFFETTSLAFNISTLLNSLLFLKLAKIWPQLMREWSFIEEAMRDYGWPRNLCRRLNILTASTLLVATVEYMLVKTSKYIIAKRCKRHDESLWKYYFATVIFPQIFTYIEYTHWKAVLLQAVNLITTFSWTFIDLFIMLMGTAIAVRFKQITFRLKTLIRRKTSDESLWREIREDYNRLALFCNKLDEALAGIILLSFSSNLFFILTQLFNSLRYMKYTLEKVYFAFSFGFLLLRTVCVTLYGAWVNDESKEPADLLNTVSPEMFNIEVRRFIELVKFDVVCLTGKNFFRVTRGLILSMAGAVVTYELVLIQFNENLLLESSFEANSTC